MNKLDQMVADAIAKVNAKPQFIHTGATQGNRNDSIYKLACKLFSKGFTFEETNEIITSFNQTHVMPPLPDKEVETTLRSASKFEVTSNDCEFKKSFSLLGSFKQGYQRDLKDERRVNIGIEEIDKLTMGIMAGQVMSIA